jgi:iron complex outermembrane recepter protein
VKTYSNLGGRALFKTGVASAVLGLALAATPAMAQEADAEGDGELIVVTGSRIARPDLTSSSPVALVTAADIAVGGNVANVENFINELPQFIPASNGSSNNPGGGLATIDLRGLGTFRTLVLVDGTRYVPSTTGGTIDINNIPTPLIERVDVVTGGASAVYGSDALAGVVNFRLKRDFSGVELGGEYRLTGRGDGQIFSTNVTVGGNFADDRGNAVISVGYTKRKPIFDDAREFSNFSLLNGRCAAGSLNGIGLGTPATGAGTVDCYRRGGSTLVPGVNFFDIGQTLDSAGNPRAFQDPADRFNFAPFNYLQIPQERINFTALGRFEINDNAEVYARGTFAYNNVPTQLAPTPIADAFDINYRTNPFITPALATALADLDTVDFGDANPGDGVVNTFFGRRQLENGPRQNPLESYAFQVQAGVRGDITGNFKYDTYYQYGRVVINERLDGDVSRQRFQQAILAVSDGAGGAVCQDASDGCVAANIFGAGRISPAAAQYIALSAQKQTVVTQQTFAATVSGDLGSPLFAKSPIGIAVGVEYRSNGGRETPDEALRRSVLGFNTQEPTVGRYSAKEVFGELNIPVVEGITGAHYFGLTAAGRLSDYSNAVGSVTSYSGGVEYAPTPDIRFRAQYQRAVRAPSISELFAGQGNNFPSATDPCSRGATVQTDAARAACARSGLPAAQIFNFTQPGGGQVEELIGGNPNLKEESSDTYTYGVVLTPTFLPRFTATIDYYKIQIDDAIDTFGGGAANILNTCYNTLGGDPTSPFCQAIVRRSNGSIDQVRSVNANISSLKFRGVDFGVNYSFKLGFGIASDESTLGVSVRGTRAIKAQSQPDPISDLIDCVGLYGPRCGEPTPKVKLNTSLNYSSGPIRINLQHRYINSVRADFQQRFSNPFRNVTELFTPSTRLDAKVKAQNYIDIATSVDVGDHVTFTLGVDNVFDKKPVVLSDAVDEQNNTYPATYDTLGRSFFLSATAKF